MAAATEAPKKSKVIAAEDVKKMFDSIDLDGDGVVSFDEFNLLIARLGLALNEEGARALFHSADTDSSGAIDIDELATFLSSGPIESSTSLSAKALRAGLMANYFAAMAAKAIAETKVDESGGTNSLSLNVSANEGCAEGQEKTTLHVTANADVIPMLPDVLSSAEAGFVLDLSVVEGKDVGELVTALNENILDDAPATASSETDKDGKQFIRISFASEEAVAMRGKAGAVLGLLTAGVDISVKVNLRQTVSEILFGTALVPLLDGNVSLSIKASKALLAMFGAGLPPGPRAILASAQPFDFSLSFCTSLVAFLASKGVEDPTPEQLKAVAGELNEKAGPLKNIIEMTRQGAGLEEDTRGEMMAGMFDMLLAPIAGVKAVYGRISGVGIVATLTSDEFSFTKPPASA